MEEDTTPRGLRLLLKARSLLSVLHAHILGGIFPQIGKMHRRSYSMSLRSCSPSRTLTSIPPGFSIHSFSPSMPTSNSRARTEGSKTSNLTPVGAAMSRTQDTRNTSQIMLTNLRYVEILLAFLFTERNTDQFMFV